MVSSKRAGRRRKMDNNYLCPKCGKRNWKRTKTKVRVKCTTPFCAYVSDVMTQKEIQEILDYVPIPNTKLEDCMIEMKESAIELSSWDGPIDDGYYIDIDDVEAILKKYLT